MSVRKANIDDLEVLLKMGHALQIVEKQYEPLLTFSTDESLEHYRNELTNDNSLFLIVEEHEGIQGYLYAHIDEVSYFENYEKECEIEVVYLVPEARGKGIADLLVDNCLEWIMEKGIKRVKTGIYAGNISSQKLFQRHGFKPYHSTYMLNNQ